MKGEINCIFIILDKSFVYIILHKFIIIHANHGEIIGLNRCVAVDCPTIMFLDFYAASRGIVVLVTCLFYS